MRRFPGLFSDSHLPYVAELEEGQTEVPSLEDMTLKAIEILQKGKEGFFLLVSHSYTQMKNDFNRVWMVYRQARVTLQFT